MGCLTAPFKLLGCLGLVAALTIGWLYRDRLMTEARRVLGHSETTAPAGSIGRPGRRALEAARAKVDSLSRQRADSVVLSASEIASLLGAGLDPELRKQLDSLQVRLGQQEVVLTARLKTSRLPSELVGPLAIALRPTEPVEAAGPLRVLGPGTGEWAVRSFRIRDIPIPGHLVPALVSRAMGDSSRRTIPLRLPEGIRDIRVAPEGATLYGASRP